jgi:hypothetical protein
VLHLFGVKMSTAEGGHELILRWYYTSVYMLHLLTLQRVQGLNLSVFYFNLYSYINLYSTLPPIRVPPSFFCFFSQNDTVYFMKPFSPFPAYNSVYNNAASGYDGPLFPARCRLSSASAMTSRSSSIHFPVSCIMR